MTHTNKKAFEAINSNGLHTYTTNINFSTVEAQGKVFSTLAASFAQAGHALYWTDAKDAKDGTVTYWAARWRLMRYLPTIDAARRFLDQIVGRL